MQPAPAKPPSDEHGRPVMGPLFHLGQTTATPGALAALTHAGQSPVLFLSRHQMGDWGLVPVCDAAANVRALDEQDPARIVSAYKTRMGDRIRIITEWDRSYTTVLLPEEY